MHLSNRVGKYFDKKKITEEKERSVLQQEGIG
jgi:hypothetical protein